jgi:hypothetical protein
MATETETVRVFNCKEPCDPPCPGKVYYVPDIVNALSRMETRAGPKIVYLECDNPKGHHTNPYEV